MPHELSFGFAQRWKNPLMRPFTSFTQAAHTEPSSSSIHGGSFIARYPSARVKRSHFAIANNDGPSHGVEKPSRRASLRRIEEQQGNDGQLRPCERALATRSLIRSSK